MGNHPSRCLNISESYRRMIERPVQAMTKLGDSSCEAGRSMNAALGSKRDLGCETVYRVCYRRDGPISIVFYRYPLTAPRDFTRSIKEDGLIRIVLRSHPLRVLQDFIQDIVYKKLIQETSPDPLDIIDDNCPIEDEQFTVFVKYMGDQTSVIKDKPPKTDGPERPSFYKNTFMKVLKSIFCCYTNSSDKKVEKDLEYVIIKKIPQYNPVGAGANIDFPDELLTVPIQETGLIEDPGEQDLISDTSGVTP